MSDKNVIKRRTGYSSVPNAAMSDVRLSISSRGLLALLMTQKSNWTFYRKDIVKKCVCGPDKYNSMIRELKQFGYLNVARTKDKKGRFGDYVWTITDAPKQPECWINPPPDKPTVGKTNHIRETNSEVIKTIGKPIAKKPLKLIPDDWLPDKIKPSSETFKRMQKLSTTELENETTKFRNHNLAKQNRSANWNKNWSTWLINAEDYKRRNSSARQHTGGGQQKPTSLLGAMGNIHRRRAEQDASG